MKTKLNLFHCQDVFAKHADLFAELKVNVNNGLGDVYSKIKVSNLWLKNVFFG